jgi:hypothetical protein
MLNYDTFHEGTSFEDRRVITAALTVEIGVFFYVLTLKVQKQC